MHHSFDIKIAKQFGVNIAIFLNNMYYWIQKNQSANKHYHDGRFWTYNSAEAFAILFDYWTEKQVRTIIANCIEAGLIVKGNYNNSAYDRTSWYAFTDFGHEIVQLPICPNGKMDFNKRENGFPESVRPIPNINTNIKPDIKNYCSSGDERQHDESKFEQFYKTYPKKKAKQQAMKAWKKNKCNEIADQIIEDVENRIRNDQQWRQIQYIPHPATYLNGKRWEDEIELITSNTNTTTQGKKTYDNRLAEAVNRILDKKDCGAFTAF